MTSCRRRLTNDDRWSKHLPDELIEMMVKRLTLADSIRFAAVCPSWKSVSSQWFRRVTRLPWLLKWTRFLDSETVNYSLYSPSEDTTYDFKFPKASRSSNEIRCSGSIDGWLIMSEWIKTEWSIDKTSINYFLQPMTGDRIMLPQLTGIKPWTSSASSDPTTSYCNVAIAHQSRLVFCSPSSHKSWRSEGQRYKNIVFLKFHEDGKLYVIDMHSTDYKVHVLVLVTDRSECELGKCKYEKIIAYKEKTIITEGPPAASVLLLYSTPSLTWSSKGELFLAWKRLTPKKHPHPEIPIIHVIKTDDTSGCNPVWVNATNHVGQDQLLLLSTSNSALISKPKSFIPTLDESFFALHSGKFFIHYWDEEGTSSNLAYGVWFKPNINQIS